MVVQEVIGKERVQVFVSTEIEDARRKCANDTYGPKANVKSSMYQQAMVEYLKSRGYWPTHTP